MLLGTLCASLLTGRGLFRAGQGMYRTGPKGQGMYRAGYGLKKKSLMPPHRFTNYEIIECFKDESKFNGVYSRNNLPKLKKQAYVINLDHSENAGTHWVVIFLKKDEAIYFDSFGVEHIREKNKKGYSK